MLLLQVCMRGRTRRSSASSGARERIAVGSKSGGIYAAALQKSIKQTIAISAVLLVEVNDLTRVSTKLLC
jgi:hypothetical protein